MSNTSAFLFTSTIKIFILAFLSKNFNEKSFNFTFVFKDYVNPGTTDNSAALALSAGHIKELTEHL